MAINLQKRINAEQTLHGYQHGHKLLAASLQLDDFSASTMARMSDMQPRALDMSSSYVCGYPLRQAKKYVISRTWLAPEMRRPGCVWTHSVLIDYGTVAQIENVEKLFGILSRPGGAAGWHYDRPMDITDLVKGETNPSLSSANMHVRRDSRLYEVLNSLYTGIEGKHAIAPKMVEDDDEGLVAAIWNQMPPRLRREFVFCTSGSVGANLPEASLTLVLTDELERLISSTITDPTGAIDDIFRDAQLGRRSVLRAFLARYVTDAVSPRIAIVPLTAIVRSLSQPNMGDSIRETAGLIASRFPQPGDCQLLKRDMLTGKIFADESLPRNGGLSLIVRNALPAMKVLRDYSDDVTIKEISNAVASDATLLEFALEECAISEPGTLGSKLLERLATELSTDEIAALNITPATKFSLAARRPDVLSHAAFWKSIPSIPDGDIWHALGLSTNAVPVVVGMLKAKRFGVLQQMLARYPTEFLPATISAIDSLDRLGQAAAIASLRNERIELLENVAQSQVSPDLVELFAEDVLRQNYPQPSALLWTRVLNGIVPAAELQPYSLLVVFKAASRASLREATPLYEVSFHRLHSLVKDGRGQKIYDIKRIIVTDFRPSSFGGYSDAADRLRVNLCRHYEYLGQPDPGFLRCAKDDATIIDLVSSMMRISGGRRWLSGVLRAKDLGRVTLTYAEEEAIRLALSSNARNDVW